MFILLSGCVSLQSQRTEPAVKLPAVESIFNEYSSVSPEEIEARIKEIEGALENRPSDGAALHLRLSVLLSHHKNPRPDYGLALKELEAYLTSSNDDREILLGFHSLLKEINRISRELGRIDRENKELKKKLELLKSLDVEIEKRRTKQK